jgi:hypothetical protein
MEVGEAINQAKQAFSQIFAGEKISDITLEEVNYDEATNVWEITLGFTRQSLDRSNPLANALLAVNPKLERSYKVVRISDLGKFLSVKNREPVQ